MSQNEFLLLMYDRGHPVSAVLAHVGAGLFALWVVSLLWEGLVLKRVTDDPLVGKLSSAIGAWATLFVVRMAAGVSIPGIIRDFNLIALLLLCGIAFWSGMRMREQIKLEEEQL